MNTYFSQNRHTTRTISVGNISIGGTSPIVVQSMTNTDTRDSDATLKQIEDLVGAGCELIRVAVPDTKAVEALPLLCAKSPVPLIADIHFDYRLAIQSLEAGIQALRINPGNIGSKDKVNAVVDAAKVHNAPIRVGVNAGSIKKDLLEKYKGVTPEAMVESALEQISTLESRGFENIKVSLKASSIPLTVAAYRLLAKQCDYPLHVGITEAGTLFRGTITSSVGIGLLLAEGIGDTLRVSLTHDPVKEVEAAWRILSALELRKHGPEIISCPTCGRTEIALIDLAEAVEEKLKHIEKSFTVAVMGCVVNGPGEARDADVGIAGGRGKGVLFRKGEVVRSITGGQEELLSGLLEEVEIFLQESSSKK